MKKLIIIDYFFKDNKGHDGRHDIAIAEEAIRQGIETEVLCPTSNQESQPLFVKKLLKSPSQGKKGLWWYCVEMISRAQELRSLLKKHQHNSQTLFFISTIDDHFLVSLFLAVIRLRLSSIIAVVVRRGLNEYYARSPGFKTQMKIWLLKPIMKFLYSYKNTIFCSDSELITTDLVMRLGLLNSCTLPILIRIPEKYHFWQKEKVIAYVGGARFDKGFDIMPAVIEKIMCEEKKVQFIIQMYLHDTEHTVLMETVQKKILELAKKYHPRIKIINEPLDDIKYSEIVAKSSILVIPYRKEFYGKGVSGIGAEAISVGSWSVTPNGTWMSEQKKNYDRIVLFDDYNADAIVRAIKIAFSSEGVTSKSRLKEQIKVWQSFHSVKNLVDMLKQMVDKYGILD